MFNLQASWIAFVEQVTTHLYEAGDIILPAEVTKGAQQRTKRAWGESLCWEVLRSGILDNMEISEGSTIILS